MRTIAGMMRGGPGPLLTGDNKEREVGSPQNPIGFEPHNFKIFERKREENMHLQT